MNKITYFIFQIGDSVVAKPLPEDCFHEFSGWVSGFRADFVQVTDQDGDVWECLPEQVFLLED